jgi:hypothetical protein
LRRLGKGEVAGASVTMMHIWPVATFLVFMSIMIHGFTVPLFNFTFESEDEGLRRPSQESISETTEKTKEAENAMTEKPKDLAFAEAKIVVHIPIDDEKSIGEVIEIAEKREDSLDMTDARPKYDGQTIA